MGVLQIIIARPLFEQIAQDEQRFSLRCFYIEEGQKLAGNGRPAGTQMQIGNEQAVAVRISDIEWSGCVQGDAAVSRVPHAR